MKRKIIKVKMKSEKYDPNCQYGNTTEINDNAYMCRVNEKPSLVITTPEKCIALLENKEVKIRSIWEKYKKARALRWTKFEEAKGLRRAKYKYNRSIALHQAEFEKSLMKHIDCSHGLIGFDTKRQRLYFLTKESVLSYNLEDSSLWTRIRKGSCTDRSRLLLVYEDET